MPKVEKKKRERKQKQTRTDCGSVAADLSVGDKVAINTSFNSNSWSFGIVTKTRNKSIKVEVYTPTILEEHTSSIDSSWKKTCIFSTKAGYSETYRWLPTMGYFGKRGDTALMGTQVQKFDKDREYKSNSYGG